MPGSTVCMINNAAERELRAVALGARVVVLLDYGYGYGNGRIDPVIRPLERLQRGG
jgi:hypothetical protein